MVASPIVGPAYQSRSPNEAMDRCINLYLEVVESKTAGKTPGYLSACPGLVYQATVGIGPIRGLHTMGNTLYVATGSEIWAVAPGFTAAKIGDMLTTSGKVSIIDNGVQVAFSDRNQLYVWSGGVLSTPLDVSQLPPGDLVYQDTLGVFNQIGTFVIWQSNPNDLTVWDGLNFTTADGSPQPIVSLIDLHRQIVALKGDSCEFYINQGAQGFVFSRLDGVFPDIGAVNAASVVNAGEEICWLGADDGGNGVFYAMGGYEPKQVSTYAQEYAISQYPRIDDCIGWSYLQAGHRFVVWNFPVADKTWVLDLTVSAQLGFPCWHERASFLNGQFHVYEPNCSCLFDGKIVVGSNETGNLYELDLTSTSDGSVPAPPAAPADPTVYIMEAKENYLPAAIAQLLASPQPPSASNTPVIYTDNSHIGISYDFAARSLTYTGVNMPQTEFGFLPSDQGFYSFNNCGYTVWTGDADTTSLSSANVTNPSAPNALLNFALPISLFQKSIDTGAITQYPTFNLANIVPINVGSVILDLTDGGSGYTHAAVAFTGTGWTGMEAIATIDASGSGTIVDIFITKWITPGTGNPGVVITGDGTGATCTATLNDGTYWWPGSDGTYRRIVQDYDVYLQGNAPILISPYTQDACMHTESCILYHFPKANDYQLVISPYFFGFASSGGPSYDECVPLGVNADWWFTVVISHEPGYSLALVPANIQPTEIAADYKLAYVTYLTPPFDSDFGVRLSFDADGNGYFFSIYQATGGDYPNPTFRLTKFVPPAVGTYGSNAPGTLTDVTSTFWSGSTGPDLTGLGYTSGTAGSQMQYTYPSPAAAMTPLRLPATNQIACIFSFPSYCNIASDPGSYDIAYLTFGGSPAIDYHVGFMTGYMTTDWVPSPTIPATGYAVNGFREINPYLDLTDYIYPGLDYSKRWLAVDVYLITGSTVGTDLFTLLVELSLVSGAPPVMTPVIPETGWDAAYALYAAAIGETYVVQNSLFEYTNTNYQNRVSDYGMLGYIPDSLIHDDETFSWWASGLRQAPLGSFTSDFNNMFELDSVFTIRASYNGQGTSYQVTPPFLKLSFGLTIPPPKKTRKWLRSWRAHPAANIKSQRYNVLEIDMEPGVAPAGSDPKIVLRYTDDSHTWSAERHASSGPTGDYARRIRFRRLGMERRGLASDRVFELSGTDTAKIILLGADVA